MKKLIDLLTLNKMTIPLDAFIPRVIKAVEESLSEKNDKTYLLCAVRNKEVVAKPEEIIRQLWIHTLLKQYHYPRERITVEYPITFGRDTSKRADVVVMDADRPTVPYLIVEVKQVTAKSGKDQLKSYTHATGAPLALWSNGTQTIVWHRKTRIISSRYPRYLLPFRPSMILWVNLGRWKRLLKKRKHVNAKDKRGAP